MKWAYLMMSRGWQRRGTVFGGGEREREKRGRLDGGERKPFIQQNESCGLSTIVYTGLRFTIGVENNVQESEIAELGDSENT